MSKLKKWVDGDLDIFNQEVEPKSFNRVKKINYEELEKSVSGKEKRKIVHSNVARFNGVYVLLSILTIAIYVVVLLMMTSYLPVFGEFYKGHGYDYYFVGNYYIVHALEDTMSVNSVTGMILDYRAFDTLGESFVLFSAVTCVLVLLQEQVTDDEQIVVIHRDTILRYVASILVPIVFVFGVYVVLNGHLSPGGGFSGGAILGAGLILYALAFGGKKASRFFTAKTFKTICSIALLGYALVKCYSFLMGGMHVLFANSHLWHDPIADFFHSLPVGSVLSGGYILILNICVGAVVACTMYGFYSLFKKGEI